MDVFKPFLQRLSQPILLAFCISWIFWNWEIVIGLLWHDSKTISLFGYKNFKILIESNSSWKRNYIFPLACALAFPGIRFGLNWFNAFVRTKENNSILRTRGTGKMSTLRFLELKDSYDQRLAKISDYLDSEAQIQIDLNKTKSENIEISEKLINKDNELAELSAKQSAMKIEFDFNKSNIEKLIKLSKIDSLGGLYDFTVWEDGPKTNNILRATNIIIEGKCEVSAKDGLYRLFFETSEGENYNIGINHYSYNIELDCLTLQFSEFSKMPHAKSGLYKILGALGGEYRHLFRYSKTIDIKVYEGLSIELKRRDIKPKI